MYSVTLGVLVLVLVQVHAQNQCPSGYDFYNGKCYRVVTEATCWSQAQLQCERSGGTLAVPGSESDLNDLMEVKSQHTGVSNSIWIGYKDEEEEGHFVDVAGNDMLYSNYIPGEPNNCCGGEDCLEVQADKRMNDIGCQSTISFICTAEPQGPINQELACRCPAMWTEFGGDCYRFFGLSRDYEESEANCQSYSDGNGQPAHLASITCDNENEFVTELIEDSWPGSKLKRAWIGMSDRRHEGLFEWTDNVVAEYSNWRVNQPDNAGNKEHCTEINFKDRGAWNDLPCDQKHASVCKMSVYDPQEACRELAELINQLVGECQAATPDKK